MKKVLTTLLCLLLALSAVEAGSVLVVCFSRTGNTRTLAEYAAAYYDADFFEIVAKVPYTEEDINYHNPKSRTSVEQKDLSSRPKVKGGVQNMDQYDTIILAYPIWWGEAPRIIETFLESYDFSSKTIIPFCTSASSGIGRSDRNLHKDVSSSAIWVDGRRFAPGTTRENLTEWLESVFPREKEREMKLRVDGRVVPVCWEDNRSVKELASIVEKGALEVSMHQYGGWEQVGSLGRSFSRDDHEVTASNGDIVLYGGNQIVLFYGENTWSYTILGHMDLPEKDITELLDRSKVLLRLE